MTAEPAPVHPPTHPLYALATFELARYRRELEEALAALSGQASARGPLQDQLAQVLAEQESRAKISGRPI
jgi:hypothetical protein